MSCPRNERVFRPVAKRCRRSVPALRCREEGKARTLRLRCLAGAHFDRNETYAYSGERTLGATNRKLDALRAVKLI